MLIISRIDYSRFREWKAGIYVAMIASILLVMLLGATARGSQRSIELGFFSFQASEVGKLLLILSLSAFLVDRVRRLGDRETTSRAVLMAIFPAMLVIAQPDLGSGLGLPRHRHGLPVRGRHQVDPLRRSRRNRRDGDRAGAGGRAGAWASNFSSRTRWTASRPSSTRPRIPREEGYQVNQSLTAIGSGGKTGRGDLATQTKLDFLPEHHTDFVFSVVGEEFGFAGRRSCCRCSPS